MQDKNITSKRSLDFLGLNRDVEKFDTDFNRRRKTNENNLFVGSTINMVGLLALKWPLVFKDMMPPTDPLPEDTRVCRQDWLK